MELTGKCKESFLKWYETIFSKKHNIHFDGHSVSYMPFSMAYGVYEDFFDYKGIAICGLPYQLIINDGSIQKFKIDFGGYARKDGRIMAIEKCNKIYNSEN